MRANPKSTRNSRNPSSPHDSAQVVGISNWAFFVVQVLFMLWNAVNDPLFGWIGDRMVRGSRALDRARIVRYGGLVWCVAFSLVWWAPSGGSDSGSGGGGDDSSGSATDGGIPWSGTALGLYFLAVLCFYDSALTMVEVNHTALLGELTTDVATRARYNACAACMAAFGSLSSLWSHMVWDRSAMFNFRVYSLFVAAIAFGAFQYTANVFSKRRPQSAAAKQVEKRGAGGAFSRIAIRDIFGKMKKDAVAAVRSARVHENLRVFLSVNFLQCFDCCFEVCRDEMRRLRERGGS